MAGGNVEVPAGRPAPGGVGRGGGFRSRSRRIRSGTIDRSRRPPPWRAFVLKE